MANPRERIVGVLREDVRLDVYGRFAAHKISMSPTHSGGPCLQDTSEDVSDTLEIRCHVNYMLGTTNEES